MTISLVELLILILASFRLTRLIVFDEITEKLRAPFFNEIVEVSEAGDAEEYIVPKKHGVKGWIGRALNCYWCTGVWASAFCCILYAAMPVLGGFLLLILAVAGGAALIELAVQQRMD
ncbi:DUF1360 domain-containing protein [Bacillus thermotolerans]|uniref:Integral membrane protein n=1 Tax=Bacillus thermotolerans TaxID=1221996 RepID=A0A0F5I5L9_BACTR|nr:DUF1360 domain-containing protein [Bacillus thermotolerans]KKB40758.1 Integral membrane protein [Bacillus thermotolerans]KKB41654.1 Integral membrane protein [Bacillus thermotolerans]